MRKGREWWSTHSSSFSSLSSRPSCFSPSAGRQIPFSQTSVLPSGEPDHHTERAKGAAAAPRLPFACAGAAAPDAPPRAESVRPGPTLRAGAPHRAVPRRASARLAASGGGGGGAPGDLLAGSLGGAPGHAALRPHHRRGPRGGFGGG